MATVRRCVCMTLLAIIVCFAADNTCIERSNDRFTAFQVCPVLGESVTWERVAGESGGYCQGGLSSKVWKSGGHVEDQHACETKCMTRGASCGGIAYDHPRRLCMTCSKAVVVTGTAGGSWSTYAKPGPIVGNQLTVFPTDAPTSAPTCKGRALTAQYGWDRCATCAKDMSLFHNGVEHFACTSCHPGSVLYITNTCYNTGPCRVTPKGWNPDGNSRGPSSQSNELVHSVCEPNVLEASSTQLICSKYAKSIPFKHGWYSWNHKGHLAWGVAQCQGHKVTIATSCDPNSVAKCYQIQTHAIRGATVSGKNVSACKQLTADGGLPSNAGTSQKTVWLIGLCFGYRGGLHGSSRLTSCPTGFTYSKTDLWHPEGITAFSCCRLVGQGYSRIPASLSMPPSLSLEGVLGISKEFDQPSAWCKKFALDI